MTSRERVLRTFAREPTDKVPRGELDDVDDVLTAQLLSLRGVQCCDAFTARKRIRDILHFDLVDVGLGSPPREEAGEDDHGNPVFRDVWGRRIVVPKDSGGAWETLEPPASTVEDMGAYVPPPADTFSTAEITRWKDETDLFVFSCVPGCFGPSMGLFGLENFLPWCLSNREAVHRWMETFCALNIDVAERQVNAGCDGIVFGDDMAYNQGTIVAPDLLRELFFPYTRRIIEFIRGRGVPVLFHSDGYVMEILPDLIDMGIDGFQSIQPSAGMDIVELKKTVGHELVLMGNVDVDLLGRGTPEAVAAEVRRLIDEIAPGGGFILSSSNALGRETSPENALAMYETAEVYGCYAEGGP